MAYTYKEFCDLSSDPSRREFEVFADTAPSSGIPPAGWVLLNAVTTKTDPFGRKLLVYKRSP
jgi:hypothetical protein